MYRILPTTVEAFQVGSDTKKPDWFLKLVKDKKIENSYFTGCFGVLTETGWETAGILQWIVQCPIRGLLIVRPSMFSKTYAKI